MLEFGALPPEINSARMYAGSGSASMMAAASAWQTLAVELGSTAAAYEAVVARLAGGQWMGSASAAMAAAAVPYVAWMNTTAALATQTATQALAAAAAFETAFAMIVPPPLITANRSLLMTLVATNFLGQNTPAIAATEAHYAQMWAQDAVAMYGYAGASAVAAQVPPLVEPSLTTNPAGVGGQTVAVAAAVGNSTGSNSEIAQLISSMPATLQSLASPLQSGSTSSASGLSGAMGGLLDPSNLTSNVNGMVNTGAWNVASTLSTAFGFLSNLGGKVGSSMGSALSGGLTSTAGAVGSAGSVAPASLGGLSGLGRAAVSASFGQASPIGVLSTPQSWAAMSPAGTGVATLQGAGWNAEGGMAPVPAGMPVGGVAGRSGTGGSKTPQYGFRPTVTMHPVAAG